jgi:hypothetical protein
MHFMKVTTQENTAILVNFERITTIYPKGGEGSVIKIGGEQLHVKESFEKLSDAARSGVIG